MINKGYLFFILVVLFGLAFSVIQKNSIKTPVEGLSMTDNPQENSNIVISPPATIVETTQASNITEDSFAEQYFKPAQELEETLNNEGIINEKYEQPTSELTPQLTKKEQLEIDFSRAHRHSMFPRNKHKKFIIDSVFEREPDEDWSPEAEVRFSKLMAELAVEYDFEEDLGKVRCSDVMCFISLKKYRKLPHFTYNAKIIRDGGFGTFKYYNGGKSKKGMYAWRFKFNSMGYKAVSKNKQ